MDTTYRATDDISVLSYHEPAGPLGFLPMHAYLVKGREPILVETGLYTRARASWTRCAPRSTRASCAGS